LDKSTPKIGRRQKKKARCYGPTVKRGHRKKIKLEKIGIVHHRLSGEREIRNIFRKRDEGLY